MSAGGIPEKIRQFNIYYYSVSGVNFQENPDILFFLSIHLLLPALYACHRHLLKKK